MSAAFNADSTGKTAVSRRGKINTKALGSKVLTVEAPFTQKLLLCWQLGDWAALKVNALCDTEMIGRQVEIVFYIAAAYFKLDVVDKAKTYLAMAKKWVIDGSLLQRVSISAVYNNFSLASEFVVPAEVKALMDSYLEHFNKFGCNLTADSMWQLLQQKLPPADFALQDSAAEKLHKHYTADDRLRIFHRPQQHDFCYINVDAAQLLFTKAVF